MKLKLIFVFCFVVESLSTTAQSPGGVGNTNVAFWLKANVPATITYDGFNRVSSWSTTYPASPSAINLTQLVGVSQPLFIASDINFNPGINADGNDFLRALAVPLTSNADFTIFHVNYYTGIGGIVYTQGATTSNSSNPSVLSSGQTAFSTAQILAGGNYGDNIPRLLREERVVGAPNTTMRNYANAIAGNSNTGFATPAVYPMDSVCVLGRMQQMPPLQSALTGSLAEVIVFNTVLSPANVQQVQSYLAVKYGITLGNPANVVNYVNSASGVTWTGTAAYQNNIAGIGRDDNAALNQLQSKSVTSNVVTMAVLPAGAGNTIPVSNAANTNSFATNNTHLIWGDNQANFEGITTDLPVGIVQRSGRMWKTQLTGTGLASRNVRVKINLTDLVSPLLNYLDYKLLLDADGVFGSGAVVINPVAGNVIDKTVEFDVDITSYPNYFFTIGTTNLSLSPLPLKFIDFTAEKRHQYIYLNWVTSDEINVDRFIVERSNNGFDWIEIENTTAKNIEGTHRYTVIDKAPLAWNNYYRIRQMDYDGKFSFSKIVHVQFKATDFTHNLSNNILYLTNGNTETVLYKILSIDGRLVKSGNVHASQTINIPVANWQKGIYVLQVSNRKSVKFLIGNLN